MSTINSRDEAQILLNEVITNLTSSNRDLKKSIRKCLLICNLLGWKSKGNWFTYEIEGYPIGVRRPNYRIISGVQSWEPTGNPVDAIFWKTSNEAYLPEVSSKVTTLDVYSCLDWIILISKTGFTKVSNEEKNVRYGNNAKSITLRSQDYFSPSTFISILDTIENLTYSFAINSYVQLKYGDLQTDIWNKYREKAELVLSSMQLSQHLDGIRQGIEGGNPEMLRTAILGCRNLLHDIAKFLWRDPRTTYDNLPGDGENGKLQVTEEKEKNRISAYLHQKSIDKKQRKYLTNSSCYLAMGVKKYPCEIW